MRRLAPLFAIMVALVSILTPVAQAWAWPLDGSVVRAYSLGPDAYAPGQHRGVDVEGVAGDPVRAPAAGAVSFAGVVPTSGRTITIQTADGLAVTLTHLGTVSVTKGDTVDEGDPIGTAGASGEMEWPTPYVHLGIRTGTAADAYVDPGTLLPPRAAHPTASEPAVVMSEPSSAEVVAPAPVIVATAAAATVPDPTAASAAPEMQPQPVATDPVVDDRSGISVDLEQARADVVDAPRRTAPSRSRLSPGAPTETSPESPPDSALAVRAPVLLPTREASSGSGVKSASIATNHAAPMAVSRGADAPASPTPARRQVGHIASGDRLSAHSSARAHLEDVRSDHMPASASRREMPVAAQRAASAAAPERAVPVRPVATPAVAGDPSRDHRRVTPMTSTEVLVGEPDRHSPGRVLGIGALALVLVLVAGLRGARRCARMMTGDVCSPEDPGRSGVAVCERPAPHRPRGGLRRSVGHLRALSPSARERRVDGQRNRRAWNADHGRSRSRRAVSA